MDIRKIIFMFLLFVQLYRSNYILPLYTTNIAKNDSIIKNDYLSKIYSSHLYAKFIIGSNKEEIKGIINMTQIGFFVYENAYDYNSSSSFDQVSNLKSFYLKNYEEGFLANDTLCLLPYNEKQDINNINIKECNNFEKVKFSLLKSKQKYMEYNIYDKYAILGLQQNSNQDEYIIPLFIKSLKNTDMINSHTFSFHFLNNTKTGENEGYILLGDEDFDEDNGFLERTLSQSQKGQIYWNLVFQKVFAQVNNNLNISLDRYSKTFDIKDAQIIGNMPYIIGINTYKNYIRYYFFEKLLLKDICAYKNVSIDDSYGTFVCDSQSDLFKEKFNNEFPKLYFEHYELNTTFILDQYDLFTYNNIDKSDKNIYFLIFFPNKNDPYINPENPRATIIKRWKLGIPFLKKYKLSFNGDNRMISYYKKFNNNNDIDSNNNGNNKKDENNSNENSKSSTLIKVIIIISLLIIFFVLGILFHKNIIRLPRKKKANELEDDYEYTINQNTLDEKKASLNNYETSN